MNFKIIGPTSTCYNLASALFLIYKIKKYSNIILKIKNRSICYCTNNQCFTNLLWLQEEVVPLWRKSQKTAQERHDNNKRQPNSKSS